MSIRWVINPVVIIENLDDDTGKPNGLMYRGAKVATLIDPATGRYYAESSAIGDDNWCVSRVRGIDFSPIDADIEMKTLLEYVDADGVLDKTLKQAGMNVIEVSDAKMDITLKGGYALDITEDSKVGLLLDRFIGQIALGIRASEMKA